ncbi:unnamed protein product [Lampetra planeri]
MHRNSSPTPISAAPVLPPPPPPVVVPPLPPPGGAGRGGGGGVDEDGTSGGRHRPGRLERPNREQRRCSGRRILPELATRFALAAAVGAGDALHRRKNTTWRSDCSQSDENLTRANRLSGHAVIQIKPGSRMWADTFGGSAEFRVPRLLRSEPQNLDSCDEAEEGSGPPATATRERWRGTVAPSAEEPAGGVDDVVAVAVATVAMAAVVAAGKSDVTGFLVP